MHGVPEHAATEPNGVVDLAALLPKEAEDGGGASCSQQGPRSLGWGRCATVGCLVLAAVALGTHRLGQRPRVLEVALGTQHLRQRPRPLEAAAALQLAEAVRSRTVRTTAGRGIIDKPQGDLRDYRHSVLPNGLGVLNIRDRHSSKVAFAVAVRAGSYDDPKDLPGLAHFCEHMLFLGTKEYPEPSGFDSFMSKSGGSNNAYTDVETTVYFGELSQAASAEGLDRFADFFRAPLFDERFVKKEVHAIDSEHAKNVQDPFRRVLEVMNSLSNPQSPVSHFYTGNLETLYDAPRKRNASPVEALRDYFDSRYCPSMMRVVTFGPAPLDEQFRSVSQEFGSLARGREACTSSSRNFSEPAPWPRERLARWITVRGTQPQSQLWVQWFLPDVSREFLSQPLQYIDYLLSYRGVDSLSRVLEDSLGLAASCEVMINSDTASTSVFLVITLASPGADHPELVLDVVFAYLARVHHNGVDEKLYQTLANISHLHWDWTEPSGPMNTVSSLAERMTRLPAEHLLSGDDRIDELNPGLVASLLERLSPDNMNVAYVNPNATKDGLFKGLRVRTMPYYGVDFTVQALSDLFPDAFKTWTSWLRMEVGLAEISAALATRVRNMGLASMPSPLPVLPRPITGIPRHVGLARASVAPPDAGSPVARSFGQQPRPLGGAAPGPLAERVQAWYRGGWVTESPKVEVRLLLRPLRSPQEAEPSAADDARLLMYGRLLAEEMAPKMVDLMATGVWYDIGASAQGLSLSLGGFPPLLPRLLEAVLGEVNRFNANTSITPPARFDRIVEEVRQDLAAYTGMPVSYAAHDAGLLLLKGPHSRDESLAALGGVHLEAAVTSIGESLLSHPLELTSLVMGNLGEREARKFVDGFLGGLRLPAWLPEAPATHSTRVVEKVAPVVKLAGPVEVRAKNPRPGDPNDAIVVTLLAGVGSVEQRVDLRLLGRIVGDLAYSELRTSRQLGYVVQAMASSMSNVQYVSAMVQGTVLRADDVEAAVELVFTELMPKRLRHLSARELGSFATSLSQELVQPPTGPSEEVGHFWGTIQQGGRCFGLRDEMLQYLNSSRLTRQRLAEVWDSLAMPKDGVRRRLVVKYFAGDVQPRPTIAEAKHTWKRQGLGEKAVGQLLRERERTLMLDRADSMARAQLVKEGGYFSQDLPCSMSNDGYRHGTRQTIVT